jgi:hypothetical protein
MPKLLLLAVAIAVQPVLHDGQSGSAAPDWPMQAYVTVADDPHETKPPESSRIEPEHTTDSVPNSVLMPPMPAAPTATMCITPSGSCALRTSAAIGSSCSCQSKTTRVFGSAQ